MSRIMQGSLIVLAVLLLSGCLSQSDIQRVIAEQPQYVQDNIGEVKHELSLYGLIAAAGVNHKEGPRPSIVLYWPWGYFATEDLLEHEIAHSFEITLCYERPEEVEAFLQDFGEPEGYLGPVTFVSMIFIPLVGEVPFPGHETFEGTMSHAEDFATVYKHLDKPLPKWRQGDEVLKHKREAVRKLMNGEYRR